MTEIEAFDLMMKMINDWADSTARLPSFLSGNHQVFRRKLQAMCVAVQCMIEISGCRRPEEALFAQREKEIAEFRTKYEALLP